MTAGRRVEPVYLQGGYMARNPTWHVEDSAWKAAQVRKALERHGLAPRTVCEVGCGAGAILKDLEQTVPSIERLVGYDISPDAHALSAAHRSERLDFKLGDLTDEAPSVTFDLLLLLDVIEHVEDYLGFLRALRGRGERVILNIPLDLTALSLVRGKLAEWREQLGHLHYFTRQSAIASVRHAGYEIDDAFYGWHTIDRPAGRRAALMAVPRRALMRVNEDLSQTLLGGASLVLLAH